ncbi:MAG: CvpA family protein [Fusicatenibacter sp.]|nr:CvpA family protein [Fusicatenibacter sp.]
MNWLRYVLLGVSLLSFILGYRKGLVKTAVSMLFLILVMIASAWLNPYVSRALEEHTNLRMYVQEKCLAAFDEHGELVGETSEVQSGWLSELGVPAAMIEQILENDTVQEYEKVQARNFSEYAAACVADGAIRMAAYFLAFVLAVIFVRLAAWIVELVAELPGLSLLNRLGGAAVGAIRALIWIWIFFTFVYFFGTTAWGAICRKQIAGDGILEWLYTYNPVTLLLIKLLI